MTDAPHILVIDDEPDIVDLVAYNLKKDGFVVSTAPDGEEALRKINTEDFALIILDLMLPGIQGMELCRMLKKSPRTENIPIIMLTAKVEEIDRILGLETGADDYMTKPFSPRELVARVKAVLRRASPKTEEENIIHIGDLVINRETYSVIKADHLLDLSATELKLLLYLIERRGKIFNREQLLRGVWKDESYVEPRTVDVHIRRLRTRIEDDPANPKYIKTKRGLGYYFDL
ncbi:MAG: response regulator [Nitrospiraceae bacterium]|jgi:phosphate regulon transcriptional regulator PhoB|nr:MAG: response regulator [Nitrospiraceae bacterium]